LRRLHTLDFNDRADKGQAIVDLAVHFAVPEIPTDGTQSL
jgi:hypothetical protein